MVARRRIRSTKDTPRHAGRLFRWQRRRSSTEDAPREENEDLTESPRTTPWLDGKEDEAAQKTSHAREENEDLTGDESQHGHALKLKQRENGTLQQT